MENNIKRKPLVAIVGRPNVGKSTLFNRISGMRKAIVEDIPGVTRDRLYADADWDGREFRIVDTGGFDPETKDYYLSLVKEQINIALNEANLIVFVMDGQSGLIPLDKEIIELLRKTDKKLLYVINKIDHEKHEQYVYDFASFGIENLIMISAAHGRNVDELLDKIVENIPDKEIEFKKGEEIKISIIGKPNVGKSTLINKITSSERMITSPLPGTTRDSIDSLVKYNSKEYIFIDTAGIRRKSRINEKLEQISVSKAISSIERSDIVLLMIDGQEGPRSQDYKLADLIKEAGKGSIILINKWDLVPDEIKQTSGIHDIVKEKLKGIRYSPVILISALEGKNIHRIFDYIEKVYINLNQRLNTNKLNKFLQDLTQVKPPPLYRGKETKIYYISQPHTNPPTFVMFTNIKKGFPDHYKSFLENKLRDQYDLEGVPIRLIFRERTNK